MNSQNSSPVFITGMQRSGTTFLRLVLNRLENLYIPFESDFLSVEAKHFEQDGELDPFLFVKDLLNEKHSIKANFSKPDDNALTGLQSIQEVINVFYSYNASINGKKRWGIKTPGYLTKIHNLIRLFPDCKIIALVRDPRDIFLSQKNISWGARDPVRFAYQWNTASKCTRLASGILSNQIMVVKYEDVVTEFQSAIRKICDFIVEPTCEDLFDFKKARTDMPIESMQWHQNSIKKPDKNKVGEWRVNLDRFEAHVITNICKSDLHFFGYTTEDIHLNILDKLTGKIHFLKK